MVVNESEQLLLKLHWERSGFDLQVDVAVAAQGFTVVWGPSGSGKTSLLRCVAGLERAKGQVKVGGDVWQDDVTQCFVPVWQRRLGYVFQDAQLFEHLSVAGNLRYGLKRSSAPDGEAVLTRAVEVLGIGHLLQRQPGTLSGGERQRVAIARALAVQPKLLLLDEPLAALDNQRKREVMPWLERLREQWQVPVLYITHSADEVTRLADNLIVLDRGRVRACGPVQDVLSSVDLPISLGDDAGALLMGRVAEVDAQWGLARVAVPGGDVWVANPTVAGTAPGDEGLSGAVVRLRVLARDVSLTLARSEGSSIQNHLPGFVRAIVPDGNGANNHQVMVQVDCGGSLVLARITARAAHQLQLRAGLPVWAQIKSASLVR